MPAKIPDFFSRHSRDWIWYRQKKRVPVSIVSTRTTTKVQLEVRKRDVMQPKTFCKTAQSDMKTTSLSITKCVQLNTQ